MTPAEIAELSDDELARRIAEDQQLVDSVGVELSPDIDFAYRVGALIDVLAEGGVIDHARFERRVSERHLATVKRAADEIRRVRSARTLLVPRDGGKIVRPS